MAIDTKVGFEISDAITATLNNWFKAKGKDFRCDGDTLVATLVSHACIVIEGNPDESGRMEMVRASVRLLMTSTKIDPDKLSRLTEAGKG
jgi:hypothetical protein